MHGRRSGIVLLAAALASTASGAVLAATAFRQNGNRIVAISELGTGNFGHSVALSADGRTALVGGPFDDGGKGAAWVLLRSGDGWTQEQKLTPGGEVGAGNFGSSVALSAGGTTALVGARYDNGSQGAAWAFTKARQAGTAAPWRQQGAKLTGVPPPGDDPPSLFGWSVSLSADGDVAVIGAPNTHRAASGQGVAWAFLRSGGVWTRQSLELRELSYKPVAQFGFSVAVAGDGLSALVGAPTYGAGSGVGRGHVARFVRRTGEYFVETSQDAYPTVDDSMAFGSSVALSYDGTFAVVGAPQYGNGLGSVWAYSYPPPGPTRPTLLGTLIPRDRVAANGAFGTSVALSRDGDTFVAGAPRESGDRGAIWAYARTQTSWDQQGSRIEAGGETGGGRLGTAVAIAADGHSVVAGAPLDNGQVGAAWSFVDRPTVTTLSPRSGPTAGGTQVTIAGSAFTKAVRVAFGSASAGSFSVLSPTLIRAVTPPGTAGTVDVTVTTSAGASAPGARATFAYVAPRPPPPPTQPPAPPPTTAPTADTKAPARPTMLRGRLVGSTLRLRWRVARDDVRLASHALYRDGRRIRTVGPKATKLDLRRFRASRRTVFTMRGVDAAGNRSAPSNAVIVRPRRTGGYVITNRRR